MLERTQPHDYDYDYENDYPLDEPDPLGVLTSTRDVLEQGEYAWINKESVIPLATQFVKRVESGNTSAQTGIEAPAYVPTPIPAWYEQYHFFDGSERTVNWLLLLDALNFCFWAEKGQPRWQIDYEGETLNGYWAEAAALKRAVEEGMPLWDARYLSTMSEQDLAYIFRSVSYNTPSLPIQEGQIPLFTQRLHIIHEVGHVLSGEYDGQFSRVIEAAEGSGVRLALLLAEKFSSFRDVTFYRQREIRFLKRAQICVADLHGAFGGQHWGAFHDLAKLTAFADYKVPQVLRHFGVLEYKPDLAARIDAQELLEAGSEEEIEIRAATIWACEFLRREMSHMVGMPVSAIEIDARLWYLGQEARVMPPYHRTRTIYY